MKKAKKIEKIEKMRKRYDVVSASDEDILRVRSYNKAIDDILKLMEEWENEKIKKLIS